MTKAHRCGWLSQEAITFYQEIVLMARFGVSADVLQQTKAMMTALSAARREQMQRKGEAQDATKRYDAALIALDTWMEDFRTAARLAPKEITHGGWRYWAYRSKTW